MTIEKEKWRKKNDKDLMKKVEVLKEFEDFIKPGSDKDE